MPLCPTHPHRGRFTDSDNNSDNRSPDGRSCMRWHSSEIILTTEQPSLESAWIRHVCQTPVITQPPNDKASLSPSRILLPYTVHTYERQGGTHSSSWGIWHGNRACVICCHLPSECSVAASRRNEDIDAQSKRKTYSYVLRYVDFCVSTQRHVLYIPRAKTSCDLGIRKKVFPLDPPVSKGSNQW